ncbi:hypothetical protein [Tortoise microvirus 11]|nr:hypothetical protein [Tortoise microvirus 11]
MRNPGFGSRKRLLKINNSEVGDDLMTKLRRRTEDNKDMNTPGRPLLYTERKHGVIPEGNPRTDRWDIAQEATDYIARSKAARRDAFDKAGGTEGERKILAERASKNENT